jgi:hypothetical protein
MMASMKKSQRGESNLRYQWSLYPTGVVDAIDAVDVVVFLCREKTPGAEEVGRRSMCCPPPSVSSMKCIDVRSPIHSFTWFDHALYWIQRTSMRPGFYPANRLSVRANPVFPQPYRQRSSNPQGVVGYGYRANRGSMCRDRVPVHRAGWLESPGDMPASAE